MDIHNYLTELQEEGEKKEGEGAAKKDDKMDDKAKAEALKKAQDALAAAKTTTAEAKKAMDAKAKAFGEDEANKGKKVEEDEDYKGLKKTYDDAVKAEKAASDKVTELGGGAGSSMGIILAVLGGVAVLAIGVGLFIKSRNKDKANEGGDNEARTLFKTQIKKVKPAQEQLV